MSDSSSSCQDEDDVNLEIPFSAWECISITLKNGHDVNLIIKNEEDMKILLQFLILKLKSFDGMRDTFNNARQINRKNKCSSDFEIM